MIATVDLGTSFTKVTIWDHAGVVAQDRTPVTTTHPTPEAAEQRAESWWESVVAAWPRHDATIDVIGFASARETFVAVDPGGTPLRPAILWSDARTPAWLAAHEPEVWQATAWLLSPRDFVVHRMTGVFATDATMRIDRRTPQVWRPTDIVGTLAPDAASALGLQPGIPVALGAGDRQCEVIGSAARAECPMVSWGTTANVSIPTADAEPVDGLRVNPAAGEGWLREGGVSAAGSLVDWLGGLTGAVMDAGLASPPGARGVVAVPWLGGARAPWWAPQAGAAFVRLQPGHDAADLMRAAVEGVGWEIARCLRRGAPDAEAIVLAGGGSNSALWAGVVTGITGLPAVRRTSPDTASVGAAALAASAIGVAFDIDGANPVLDRIPPDPTAVEAYRSLAARADAAADAIIRL